MAEIKFEYEGIPFTVSDPKDVGAIIRELKGVKSNHIKRMSSGVPSNTESSNKDDLEITLAFLTAIDSSGDRGADADRIGKALKVEALRGIGGRSVTVNKILENLGFTKISSVYDNSRTSEGRFWRKGQKLPDAIEAIRKQLNG